MTTGDEDGDEDEGSDSEPSEDNFDEEEMAKIIPLTPKAKPEIKKEDSEKKVSTAKGKKVDTIKRPSRSGLASDELKS
jgi:hypothetical protein